MRITIVAGLGVVAIFFGVWAWSSKCVPMLSQASADYKNATYIIDGKPVTLIEGHAKAAAEPGAATNVVTDYFGNETMLDLDNDGREDVVFLLTQQTGGSGIFYYVVVALHTADGYVGSHGLLLGDRIAPQTIEKGKGYVVVVNYADRALTDSFTVVPSIGKSIYLLFDPIIMQFGEVVQNFEGEANPASMTLSMQTWTWVLTLYNNDTVVVPKKENVFTLTFKKDGSFSATTDCNSVSGTYSTKEKRIAFEKIAPTKMYCYGSQEGDFVAMLQKVQSYLFTPKGELILDFKFDSGIMTFR